MADTTAVAIACQGGGSHTAFTGGVLARLLPNVPADHEIIALSGTSGGAACAALTWYGIVHPEKEPAPLVREFWEDMAATTMPHRVANAMVRWSVGLQRMGVPVPEVSPAYSPGSWWGEREFRSLLADYIDFDDVPELCERDHPGLFMSAIEVCDGRFKYFREEELSPDAILASAAEPHLFEAVEFDGNHYWDGLFASNPPMSAFMDADDVPDPDEIWLVKINPRERPAPPRSMEGINNRRNELSGNLSLTADVRFIERVNDWIEKGYLPDRYTHTKIRRISFPRGHKLDWRTKLDRDPSFIDRLLRDGEREAETFLETL